MDFFLPTLPTQKKTHHLVLSTEKALKQKTSCGSTPTPGLWPLSTAPQGVGAPWIMA